MSLNHGSSKILVADDEPDLIESYVRLLRGHGYDCIAAANGKLAMELAARERPILLITDLEMPIINGFELTRWIRRTLPKARVIAMTGFHTAQGEWAARAAGAHLYLRKPFSNAELLSAIRLVMSSDSL